MEIKLSVNDVISIIAKMSNDEKKLLCESLSKDDCILQTINEHYYSVLTARENIIKKREAMLKKYIEKYGLLA